jgi:hypothetical protein
MLSVEGMMCACVRAKMSGQLGFLALREGGECSSHLAHARSSEARAARALPHALTTPRIECQPMAMRAGMIASALRGSQRARGRLRGVRRRAPISSCFDFERTCVLSAPRDARALAPRAQARASRARHVQDARSTDCGSVGARHSIFASVAETRGGSRTSPACAELRSKFRAQSAAWYHTPFAIMRVDTLRVWLSDFRMEPIHFEEVTVLVFGNNNV